MGGVSVDYKISDLIINFHVAPLRAGLDIERLEGFELSPAMHNFMVNDFNRKCETVEEQLVLGEPFDYMGLKISVNETFQKTK